MRDKSLFTAVFLNFIGYSVYLLLLFYGGFSASSLGFSILVRIVILISLIFLFVKSNKLRPGTPTYIFIFFSIFYLSRIFIDALRGLPYYVSTTKLILYYLSFDMIPFLLICNLKFRITDFTIIRKALLLSGFVFSILALFLFRNYVGMVGRLTSVTAETDTLSPLSLSYCSALAIGVALIYWMENKVILREKIYLLLIILLSAIPFFLGSSRGSLVALVFPFILIFVSKKSITGSLRLILITLVSIILIIYFSEYFGSSLIERVTNTGSDMEAGDESAVRSIMWRNAFNQFLDNPIMGDRLKLDEFNIHPHNIVFEILQTTGLLGFIPFLILFVIIYRKSIKIFKYAPRYSWLGVLFIQSFIQNMFSGSIYGASWVMMSGALVIAFGNVPSSPAQMENNQPNFIQ